MRPFDDTTDPFEWREALEAWKEQQRQARANQETSRGQLDAAEGRLAVLNAWASALANALNATAGRAAHLDDVRNAVAGADAAIAAASGEIEDRLQAREIATARVLAGPPSAVPIVLLPLRLQTCWDGATLKVRVYPDVLSVDAHDPRLTDEERAAGSAYWAQRAGGQAAEQQAWENLLRGRTAPRAAWVATATRAGAPADTADVWDIAVDARLLPDRFAVVAYAAGEPLNVAGPGEPPRYATWGRPVADPLPVSALHAPEAATWMNDFPSAVDAGMAVTLTVPAGSPPIEQLLVVGVRGGAGDLAGLLEAHAYTDGIELLPDGAPTNNSDEIRALHSPAREAELARRLLGEDAPPTLADGSAGARLADALGLPRPRVAAFPGATADRDTTAGAMRTLVGAAATGPLAGAAWPIVAPAGALPVVRVGRQPYGVVPATAPARWRAAANERSAPLAPLLNRWGRDRGAPVDIDPADPPAPAPAPRRVSGEGEGPLTELLLELPASIAWTGDDGSVYAGLDGLVGPQEGPQAPGAYLPALAAAGDGDLDALAAGLPPALLARIALVARRSGAAEVRAALGALAGQDRVTLARLLGAHLDALAHRIDAWHGAASEERMRAQRAAGAAPAVGAYGYLTDVHPRTEPRSHGHVHAPSLAHAATAAVLRSGHLGQRRAAWAARVAEAEDAVANAEPGPELAAAQRRVRAARTGLATLGPLGGAQEATLSMAVDLSSRRVREARWTLSAVRGGQPLGAVLGYHFERALADAGLQRYLAAFRKLTRFSTGTRLEGLEDTRSAARAALAAAQAQLAALQAAIGPATTAADAARQGLQDAQAAEQRARDAAAPYIANQQELAGLDGPAGIAALEAALAAVDARRPVPRVEQREINVP